MKWGKLETENMQTSHLNNCINWINREWAKERLGKGSNKAIDLIRQSQINCIRAELDFRNGLVDNRLNVEIQHEENEKSYKEMISSNYSDKVWEKMRFDSDTKFEDTFGHHPSEYDDYQTLDTLDID